MENLPGFSPKRNFPKNRSFRPVTKGHFLESDLTRQAARLNGIRPADHIHGRVQHLKHTPGRRETLLNGIGDGRNVGDLSGELLEQAGKHHQAAAQGNLLMHVQPAAIGE